MFQTNNVQDKPGEKCGIFGAHLPGEEDTSRVVYFALWALQHRGQESSGITSAYGQRLFTHKGMGLVAQAYTESDLLKLPGSIAVGHNRYSTSRASNIDHAQPVTHNKSKFALVHNGNLPSTKKLETFLTANKIKFENLNDSEMMATAIDCFQRHHGLTIETAIQHAYPLFTGVFCLLIITPNKLIALRDPYGVRPLSLAKLNGGFVVGSETCAFDTIGAKFIRDIAPGEMLVISGSKYKSIRLAHADKETIDLFEFVYFARPDSMVMGKSVWQVRYQSGAELANLINLKADVVVPVPDSARALAEGFAEKSGIPVREGLVKNRYIHRTFIQPSQRLRKLGVELKLNPNRAIISGQRVVLMDDSIVRGTTMKEIVTTIKKAGAKKVHVLIGSPPVKYPDFYGIDTPNQKQLIAAKMSLSATREFIGADSLHYLPLNNLIRATGIPKDNLNCSCFTGVYPAPIGEQQKQIKTL